MNWKLLYNSEIDSATLDNIFWVYEKVYKAKGINKSREIWESDFNKLYHKRQKKLTFLITDHPAKNIIGYVIFTEPVNINGELWSKILEGGVYNDNKIGSRLIFMKMFRTLFEYSDENEINFFSEASPSYNSLLRLMFNLEFSLMKNKMEACSILNTFFCSLNYELFIDNRILLINRNTNLFEKYTGCLIKRRAQSSSERFIHNNIEQLEFSA